MNDLSEEIEQAATEPASSASDGQSATGRPLADLIEADRYLKGGAALSPPNSQGGPRSGWGSLRIARAIPPEAV